MARSTITTRGGCWRVFEAGGVGFFSRGCFARDLEARLLQQQAAALPHDGMVIDQQDRDRGSHFIARLVRGGGSRSALDGSSGN
ncbi:MAG: hypothetical protein M3436_08470 [Pseudomonadota bacterium]|nr:hypothetical protein [Pseudomonadota bacterium]